MKAVVLSVHLSLETDEGVASRPGFESRLVCGDGSTGWQLVLTCGGFDDNIC